MNLAKQKVVVVGGGSGMGLAIATAAHTAGADIIIASRTLDKLKNAASSIGERAKPVAIDMTEEASIEQFFRDVGTLDHLVITASSVKTGSLKTLPTEDAFASMRSKFWGPYLCARYAQISPSGSMTFFSGVLSRKPAAGLAALCGVNAAVEGLVRALAIELAPVRVNVISPGLIDTGAYDRMPEAQRKAFFEGTAKSLPVGRVGKPEDIAEAALMLMTNGFMTGVTLDIDGGTMLGAILPPIKVEVDHVRLPNKQSIFVVRVPKSPELVSLKDGVTYRRMGATTGKGEIFKPKTAGTDAANRSEHTCSCKQPQCPIEIVRHGRSDRMLLFRKLLCSH